MPLSTRPLLLFFCLNIFILTPMLAQYDDLLNNPDISWIAEQRVDHSFALDADDSKEIVTLIKFFHTPTKNDYPNTNNWIIQWLYYDAINGESEVYKDPGLTQKMSEKELHKMTYSVDTVTTFDPDSFEESVVIVTSAFPHYDIQKLRINQLIYFNKKTNRFSSRVLAVAPLFDWEKTGYPKPLFWIKMNEGLTPADFDVHAEHITWGALAYSKEDPLAFNFIEVVKNTADIDLRKKLYDQAINMERPVEDVMDYGSSIFLKKEEVREVHEGIDTITTFDPNTYQESVKIIKNDWKYKDILQYRLVQEWYYDQEKHKLLNRLTAIAPIVQIKNKQGEFKYNRILYYLRYDEE